MRHSKITLLGMVGCLALSAAVLFSYAQELVQFEQPEYYQRYQRLIFELRCPKCQNQNVADSNAPIAADMRQKTAELLNQGYTDEQIMDFMIDRYTEFVTYKPRVSWVTVWLWLIPVGCLLFGLGVFWRLSHRGSLSEVTPLSAEEQQRLQALLEKDKL